MGVRRTRRVRAVHPVAAASRAGRIAPAPDHPANPEDDPDEEGLELAPTFRSTTSNDVTAFNADRSCVFAVSEKYRGGANPDRLDRAAMRDALALAYERHLIDVEADIADEEQQGK